MPTPKSRKSIRKVRRWGFSVQLTNDKGQVAENTMPNMMIGTRADARESALELEKGLVEEYKEFKIAVTPVGHETVSDFVVKGLARANHHIEILDKAIELMCHGWIAQPAPESLDPGELSALWVKKAVEFYHPQPVEPAVTLTDALPTEPIA